jgi:hypothetical protein
MPSTSCPPGCMARCGWLCNWGHWPAVFVVAALAGLFRRFRLALELLAAPARTACDPDAKAGADTRSLPTRDPSVGV